MFPCAVFRWSPSAAGRELASGSFSSCAPSCDSHETASGGLVWESEHGDAQHTVADAGGRPEAALFLRRNSEGALPYIIPPMSPMPPMPPGIPAPAFSGGSATIASVIKMLFAIEAAF
jgi:hypothetical protein